MIYGEQDINGFRKYFAWFPKRMSDGRIVWWESYGRGSISWCTECSRLHHRKAASAPWVDLLKELQKALPKGNV